MMQYIESLSRTLNSNFIDIKMSMLVVVHNQLIMTDKSKLLPIIKHINNKQDFVENVEKYHSSLLSYAFYLTGDVTLSKDLVQEAYYRAWVAKDSLKDWNAFRGWLNTILKRESARYFSKNKIQIDILDDNNQPTTKDDALENAINVNQVAKKLDQLPYIYKEVLTLYALGFTCEEISKRLELKLNTVLTRLQRARAKL